MVRDYKRKQKQSDKMYMIKKLKARETHEAIKQSSKVLNTNPLNVVLVLDEGEAACKLHADVMLGFKPEDEDK